jgi:type I restriction enzyme R subunit
MRPINSMIEFKQIIGRGTRLFEGKHYFTIIDFVNAYHMFSDAEWDGEALEPEPKLPTEPRNPNEPTDTVDTEKEPAEKKIKLKIKLSDGKIREIKSMSTTLFYLNGMPLSSAEFLKRLFNTLNLPEFFGSEQALRDMWANPLTRRDLLAKLEQEGCAKADLLKLQEMIDAENSDLFDVLEYISYARKPISRAERVDDAEAKIFTFLNEKQREFIKFVLRNYVQDGVDELDVSKLSSMLTAKYGGIHAAQTELGNVDDIQYLFIDFQKHLYNVKVA